MAIFNLLFQFNDDDDDIYEDEDDDDIYEDEDEDEEDNDKNNSFKNGYLFASPCAFTKKKEKNQLMARDYNQYTTMLKMFDYEC